MKREAWFVGREAIVVNVRCVPEADVGLSPTLGFHTDLGDNTFAKMF
jgi:hypothetical protein